MRIIPFLLSAVIFGVCSQLTWFVNSAWDQYSMTLAEAVHGDIWEKHQMGIRLLISPFLTVGVFFLLRLFFRRCVRSFAKTNPELFEKYKKHDTSLYTFFALSITVLFGLPIKPAWFLTAFLLIQSFWAVYCFLEKESDTGAANFLKKRDIHLLMLFFISGFAALIYQICWQRLLFHSFGVNIESVTIIVSIFMFGLGAGSLLGGFLSKKFPQHLIPLFFFAELSIGMFGFFSSSIIKSVSALTLGYSLPVIAGTVYGLLFIPTAFMGATLPILTAYFYQQNIKIGKSVSYLYFSNTIGSAFAAWLTVDFFFHYGGLQSSTLTAALLNLAVAFFALRLSKKKAAGAGNIESVSDASVLAADLGNDSIQINKMKNRYWLVLFLAAAVGFISLSQEILWVRLLSYFTMARAGVFGKILFFFLGGVALGSLWAKKLLEKHSDKILILVFYLISGSFVSYFIFIPILSWCAVFFSFSSTTALFYLLIGLIAFLLGAVFPLLAHYAVPFTKAAGWRLSGIYFANIIGSVLGPLVTGFYLLQHFELEENVLLISLLAFFLSLILFIVLYKNPQLNKKAGYAYFIIFAFLISQQDQLYGNLLEKLHFRKNYFSSIPFKHTIQNRSGIINVIGGEEKAEKEPDIVLGGGIYDGRFNINLLHDFNGISRAYIIPALHPAPARLLVIGLSSSSWVRAVAQHPSIKKIDVIEINPGYLKLIKKYPRYAPILKDPKLNIIIDDGRRWLLRNSNKKNPNKKKSDKNSDEKYDFILMNTTYHWRSQINSLLSKEFFALLKDRLLPGGVVYFNTTGSEDVYYTLSKVFRYITRYAHFAAGRDVPFPRAGVETEQRLLEYIPFMEFDSPEHKQGTVKKLKEMAKSPFQNHDEMMAQLNQIKHFLHVNTDDNLASEFKRRKIQYSRHASWLWL